MTEPISELISPKDQPGQILFLALIASTILLITLFFFEPARKLASSTFNSSVRTTTPQPSPSPSPYPKTSGDLTLISHKSGDTLTGTTPLTFTLGKGNTINKGSLSIDYKTVETFSNQSSQQMTINLDTTKYTNGEHSIIIVAIDEKGTVFDLQTKFTINNGPKKSSSQ